MENFHLYVLYSINTAYDVNIKQQYYQEFNIFCRLIIGVYNVHIYTLI